MRTIDFKQPEGINFQKKLKNETQGGGAGNPIIHTGVYASISIIFVSVNSLNSFLNFLKLFDF